MMGRPRPQTKSERYGYFWRVLKNRKVLWLIRDHVDFSRDMMILDAGCGPGYVANFLTDSCTRGSTVVGLDAGDDVLLRAQQNCSPEVALCKGTLQRLPFGNDRFDAVVCVSVVEHLPHAQRRQAVNSIMRALKPGGLALFVVPTILHKLWSERFLGLHERAVYGFRLRRRDFFSPKKLIEMHHEIPKALWSVFKEPFDLLPTKWVKFFSGCDGRITGVKGFLLFCNMAWFVKRMQSAERRLGEKPIFRMLGTSLCVMMQKV